MKLLICSALCLFAALLSAQADSIQPREANFIVKSYAYDLAPLEDVDCTTLDCYKTYLSLINIASEDAKNKTQACMDNMNNSIASYTQQVDATIDALNLEIAELAKQLTECPTGQFGAYVNCIKDKNSQMEEDALQLKLAERDLINYKSNMKANENQCIDEAIQNSINRTDEAYANLAICLKDSIGLSPSDISSFFQIPK